jgi:hypothetical protein
MILNDTTNLNGILQDIYFNGKINATTFATNDLLRIINKYYAIAQSDIRSINEDFYGEIATLDLQTNTGGTYPNEYTLPEDYEKIKQIQVAFNPANPSSPLSTEFQIIKLIGQQQISDPEYIFDEPTAVLYDNSFFLYPIPGQNVTKGLKLFYIKQQPSLELNTDIPNIFTDYQDIITWGSLIDISIRLGNQMLFQQANLMFTTRRAEMKKYASGRALEMAGAYIEGQQLGDWSFPFGNTSMS